MKIELYPNPRKDLEGNKGDNPHFKLLIEAWNSTPGKNLEITLSDAGDSDAVLMLWPDSILERHVNSVTYRVLSRASHSFAELYLRSRINLEIREIQKCNKPLFWQIHELTGHHIKASHHQLDRMLRQALADKARLIFVTEESSIPPVLETLKLNKSKIRISNLGSYKEYYGPKISTNSAKKILGISPSSRTILLFGRARNSKNHSELLNALIQRGFFLILAGQNYDFSNVEEKNCLKIDGFIDEKMVSILFSAADFVIKPEEAYLNSGVIRLAISYGKPVIAHEYGATIDLAHGCLIRIGKTKSGQFEFNSIPQLNSEDYDEMCDNAEKSDRYRTWERAALSFKNEIWGVLQEESSAY